MSVFEPAVFPAVPSFADPTPAFFASRERAIDICAHLRPYSDTAGGEVDLYLSQYGFVSEPADTPADTIFPARILGYKESRRSVAQGLYGGRGDLASALLTLSTMDDEIVVDGVAYDTDSFLREFSIVGRKVEIRLVSGDYASGYTLFDGTAEEWDAGRSGRIELRLRGKGLALDTALQPATYAGTGDTEGGDDLEGKGKPVCLGNPRHIRPVLEVPAELLYRVHTDASGAGAEVSAIGFQVFIGGVSVLHDADYATTADLRAASVPSGFHSTCYAEGAFRLGGPEPDRAVSVNAAGYNFQNVPNSLTGAFAGGIDDIFADAVIEYGPGLSASEVDFTALEVWVREFGGIFAPDFGVYIGPEDRRTSAEILNEIGRATSSIWSETRDGKLTIRHIRRPAGNGIAELDENDILRGSWRWLPTPAGGAPYLGEVGIGYSFNHSVGIEVAGGASDLIRSYLSQDWRRVRGAQSISRYAESATAEVNTIWTDKSGAERLRDDLLGLFDGTARRASFAVGWTGYWLSVGDKITVSMPSRGVSRQPAFIIGGSIDTARLRATLEVLLAS